MDLKFERKQKTKAENENKQIRTTLIKKIQNNTDMPGQVS